ncbi:retrovirus-related pol polyprotein from transposon TNT 1-94 [Tanacetum coccineum]
MSHSNAVMGNWGSTVKTSTSYNWRNSRPNFNYNSGPTFIRTVNAKGPQCYPKPIKSGPLKRLISLFHVQEHPLKNMVDRGIFNSGCSGHMTGNKDQLDDFEEFNGGSVTFGGSATCNITFKGTKRDTLSVLGKFDGKSDEGFLVGYSLNSKAYRVYNLVTKRVEVNMHVNFLEDKPNVKGVGYRWMFDIDYLTDSMNYIPVSLENQANPHAGTPEKTNNAGISEKTNNAGTSQTPKSNASEEKDEDVELIVVPSAVTIPEEILNSRTSSTKSKKEKILTDPQQEEKVSSTDTLKDNLKIQAFRRELEQIALKHLGTAPENNSTSTPSVNNGSQTVNTGRLDHDDSPMPELENLHNKWQDNQSSFSSTVIFKSSKETNTKINSIVCMPVSISGGPKRLLKLYKMIVVQAHARKTDLQFKAYNKYGAFLYGTIDEEVYVSQPPGFVDPDHPNKRARYKRGTIDKTLFIKRDKKDIMLVQVYVDDIIFGSTNKSWCDEFEALMKSRFQMSSMGELTFFLGLQVKQNKGGIFISQDKYVAEILKKFDLVNVKVAITPMETKVPLTKDEEAIDVDVHLESPFDLEAFSDSDYGGSNLDRKSTTGGCQFLGQRLISRQCKKQTIVATSTTEAEYVAALKCCGQVLWVQNQLLDYGFCNIRECLNF